MVKNIMWDSAWGEEDNVGVCREEIDCQTTGCVGVSCHLHAMEKIREELRDCLQRKRHKRPALEERTAHEGSFPHVS